MRRAIVVAVAAAVAIVGARAGLAAAGSGTVVLVTHDSFAISKSSKAAFEKQSGLRLRILQSGDAGAALNRALLTAGKPEGDVFFGVDNNLLSRALAGKLFNAYTPPALAQVDRSYDLDPAHRLVPIDHGDICLVYDRAWFAKHGCGRRTPSKTSSNPDTRSSPSSKTRRHRRRVSRSCLPRSRTLAVALPRGRTGASSRTAYS